MWTRMISGILGLMFINYPADSDTKQACFLKGMVFISRLAVFSFQIWRDYFHLLTAIWKDFDIVLNSSFSYLADDHRRPTTFPFSIIFLS